ncbi:DoxX family protein [Kiritimatiellota bacterium B12222]|nr:DoxX family protein [Kiritimatiellota bacterium B12222]
MKNLLSPHSTHPFLQGVGLLSIRLMFGLGMLMGHGWGKLMSFSDLSSSFSDPLGISHLGSLIAAIFAEVVCAALVSLGLFTRIALLPLIFTMIIAAFVVHGNDPFATREKALLYLAAYIGLFFTGPGKLSLDSKLHRHG